MIDALKKIIGEVAPTLATALGGPLAGAAVAAIAKALGTSEDDLPSKVESMTAADLIAIKRADQEFALKMQEMVNALAIKQIDADMGLDKAVTDRWVSDNQASMLAQNIRPVTLMVLVGLTAVVVINDMSGIKLSEGLMRELFLLDTVCISAYFGLRSYEKVKK
jgi:hypothetical protein